MKLELHVQSGKILDLAKLTPKDINLRDIAHSLANTCRYGGHIMMFYSVAEHSVRASYLVKKKSEQKRVLMHDAVEAYIGDMVHPIKICIPQYIKIEEELQKIIAKKYRFAPDFGKADYVKLADRAMAAMEIRDLIVHDGTKFEKEWWDQWAPRSLIDKVGGTPWVGKIYPWIPREAKERFLARAHQLGLL